jgi:hypothetical protein
MANRETQRALKARKAAVRKQLAQRRAQLKGRQRPMKRQRRRKWRFVILALALLLYLLLRGCNCQCDCGPGAPPVLVDAELPEAPLDAGPKSEAPKKAKKPKRKKRRFKGKLKGKARPGYSTGTPGPQAWLPAFRMQVAARSPRLARCFEGSEQPGALKWTASVDTARGVVSDHHFGAVLQGAQLSKKLRRCLVGVLAKPVYQLPKADPQTSPARVSIVIEF